MKKPVLTLSLLFGLLAISACKSISVFDDDVTGNKKSGDGKPWGEQDSGPDTALDVAHIAEPVPRVEPRDRAGNRSPYRVLGQTYTVMDEPLGYAEQGIASWYGKKFHGRRTSNGEVYNMYGMTAAHKSLPIPSYVRVTNQANRQSVIVRINDRGPFHAQRIIDLSYTAARKLGFAEAGTARVSVQYIDPLEYANASRQRVARSVGPAPTPGPKAPKPRNTAGYELPVPTWLQVGAFATARAASKMQGQLESLTTYPVVVMPPEAGDKKKLYRVRIGPLKDNFDLMQLSEKIVQASYPQPHRVTQRQ